MGALVAKGVRFQDADGRGDRDCTHHEDAKQELDAGPAGDGWLGAAPPTGLFLIRGNAGG